MASFYEKLELVGLICLAFSNETLELMSIKISDQHKELQPKEKQRKNMKSSSSNSNKNNNNNNRVRNINNNNRLRNVNGLLRKLSDVDCIN